MITVEVNATEKKYQCQWFFLIPLNSLPWLIFIEITRDHFIFAPSPNKFCQIPPWSVAEQNILPGRFKIQFRAEHTVKNIGKCYKKRKLCQKCARNYDGIVSMYKYYIQTRLFVIPHSLVVVSRCSHALVWSSILTPADSFCYILFYFIFIYNNAAVGVDGW